MLDTIDRSFYGHVRDRQSVLFGILPDPEDHPMSFAVSGKVALVICANPGMVDQLPAQPDLQRLHSGRPRAPQATQILLQAQGTQAFGAYSRAIDTHTAEQVPPVKATSADIAQGILSGVQSGTEDIVADPMSVALGGAYLADPKSLERQLVTMGANEHRGNSHGHSVSRNKQVTPR
jgi:hypothetical protein